VGGTSCTLSKDFEKLGHKNEINTKIDFLTTPSTPSKEFENDCAAML
jgi:hypothetical protein